MIAQTMEQLPGDDRYIELVRRFPLHVIRDEADLDRANEILDRLLDQPDQSAGEREYLAVLGLLIEDFERHYVDLPGVTGIELLRHLMEENNLTQSEIAPLFGGNRSIVSEVLHGKRPLALSHIRQLSEYFGLPADIFIN